MTSFEAFKDVLTKCQVEVPEESLEMFRDLVDMQTDVILDAWLKTKEKTCEGVK